MAQVADWIKLSLPWLIPWLLFMAALIAAIRNLIAAERGRRDLQQVSLEKEKLELEVARLRRDPELIADRRAIYERLRAVMFGIIGPADVTRDQIGELHDIRHASLFRFPKEVPREIEELISAAITIHVNKEVMEHQRNRVPDAEWKELVDKETSALKTISSYLESMAERFMPLLSL